MQVAASAALPSSGAGGNPSGQGFLKPLSSQRKKLFTISQEVPPWTAKEDGLSAQ